VLLTALGWIFWQNFIYKESMPSSKEEQVISTVTQDTAKPFLDGRTNDVFGPFLTFKYPSDWKLTEKTTGEIPANPSRGHTSQVIEISSPTGKYSVVYSIGANGGLGGMCLPEENGVVKSLQYGSITNFPQVGYATYITSNQQGTHNGFSGLVNNTVAAVKEGDNACELAYSNIINQLKKDTSTVTNLMILDASVHPAGEKEGEQADYYEKLYSGEEFETAKTILLSTRLQ
jgi:hypothetical protein